MAPQRKTRELPEETDSSEEQTVDQSAEDFQKRLEEERKQQMAIIEKKKAQAREVQEQKSR